VQKKHCKAVVASETVVVVAAVVAAETSSAAAAALESKRLIGQRSLHHNPPGHCCHTGGTAAAFAVAAESVEDASAAVVECGADEVAVGTEAVVVGSRQTENFSAAAVVAGGDVLVVEYAIQIEFVGVVLLEQAGESLSSKCLKTLQDGHRPLLIGSRPESRQTFPEGTGPTSLRRPSAPTGSELETCPEI